MRVKLSTGGQNGGAEGSRAKPTIFRSARPAAQRREGQAQAETPETPKADLPTPP